MTLNGLKHILATFFFCVCVTNSGSTSTEILPQHSFVRAESMSQLQLAAKQHFTLIFMLS